MKRLILLLLLMAVTAFGQRGAQYWGVDSDIEWNKSTRFNSDSVDFWGNKATQLDTVGTDSVFYSALIEINGDGMEGIFNLTFSVDSTTGSDARYDSLDLYLRRYFKGHDNPPSFN